MSGTGERKSPELVTLNGIVTWAEGFRLKISADKSYKPAWNFYSDFNTFGLKVGDAVEIKIQRERGGGAPMNTVTSWPNPKCEVCGEEVKPPERQICIPPGRWYFCSSKCMGEWAKENL
jgi:hypothetical protein